MTHEKEIAILKEDRCTEREAEKLLKNGTQIWEDPEDYINSLKESDCWEGQTVEDMRRQKISNVFPVEYEGHEYFIEYVN